MFMSLLLYLALARRYLRRLWLAHNSTLLNLLIAGIIDTKEIGFIMNVLENLMLNQELLIELHNTFIMRILGLYLNIHQRGNCWKYTMDIGKLRICWKPVKAGRRYIVFDWG